MGTGNWIRDRLFIILIAILLVFIAASENVHPTIRDAVQGALIGTGAFAWAYVLLVILRGNGD